MTWQEEVQAITTTAARYNVDPLMTLAIRIAEGPTSPYQFGILHHPATTYTLRLNECCATIRHLTAAYHANPFLAAHSWTGVRRLAYTDAWITSFGGIYCPIGADNDPRSLNRNWNHNVITEYTKLLTIGTDDPSWITRWNEPIS